MKSRKLLLMSAAVAVCLATTPALAQSSNGQGRGLGHDKAQRLGHAISEGNGHDGDGGPMSAGPRNPNAATPATPATPAEPGESPATPATPATPANKDEAALAANGNGKRKAKRSGG